jgi:hypothetical protein
MLREDGCANTASGTGIANATPENMRKLISPLWKRVDEASKRWNGQSLTERTKAAESRWISRIDIKDSLTASDYEKKRTKDIKSRIKHTEVDDNKDITYLDGQVDDFLAEYLRENGSL